MKEKQLIIKNFDQIDLSNDNVLIITSNYFTHTDNSYINLIKSKANKITIYDEVKPNPALSMVCDSIRLLNENKCNKIIALGGGSVIDVAKSVSIFFDKSEKEIWKYFTKQKSINNLEKSKILIAIPTTYGTGSEYNKYSVITNNSEKRSVSTDLIIPDIVYKDSAFMKSLSYSQKILGIFDCFMHAVECYISKKSTEMSKSLSNKSLDLVLKILKDVDNIDNTDIMRLSEMSGQVENLSSCISLHTLGHAISSLNPSIIHGESILLIARRYFQLYRDLENKEIIELDQLIHLNSNYNSLDEVIKLFEEVYYSIEKQKTNKLLSSYFELSSEDIYMIAKKLSQSDNKYFVNDPINLTKKQFLYCLKTNFLDIKKEVLNYIKQEDIYFINSNCGIGSHDTDIYCVKKGSGSSTHCFYDNNGNWIELFIDSLENLNYKIETADALGINYASMLYFYWGDKNLYDQKYNECLKVKNNYNLYKLDELLLTYRIQISFEKINKKNHEYSNRMLCSALIYPFVSLLLGMYHVFPTSPRNWMSQLEEAMGEDFKDLECLFDGKYNYDKIGKLIDKYTKKLKPIDIYFEGKNRRSRVE